MAENIQELMSWGLALRERLVVTVRIYDEEKRDAPIGADVAVLQSLMFVGGTAEFVYAYAGYLTGDTSAHLYDPPAFSEFERQLRERIGDVRPNWIELYQRRPLFELNTLFLPYIAGRRGGYRAIGSSDIIRLELVDASKENPSVRKIIVSGVAAAVMTISGAFAAVQIIREYNREQCIVEAYNYGNEQAALLAKMGRFHGPMPDESYAKLQDVVNARLASCGSPLAGIGVKLGPDGVALEASSRTDHSEK